jgi:hypothetical protein
MKARIYLGVFIAFIGSQCFAQRKCQITRWLPTGLERQGGYSFDYQSGRGSDCRDYRLHNEPGQVRTPVDWRDKRDEVKEILFDGDLADCPKATSCPWVEEIKISTIPSETGDTALGYGVPKDEYSDKVGAYRQEITKQGAGYPPFTTILRGVIGGRKVKQHQVAIEVTSSVSGTGPFQLTYRIELAGESEPLGTAAKITSDAELLSFDWQAASTPTFREKLRSQLKQLTPKSSSLEIELSAPDITLETTAALVIYEAETAIAATSAPAYRPKEGKDVAHSAAGLALAKKAD